MNYLKTLFTKTKIKDHISSKSGYIYYIVGEGLSKGIVFLLLAFYTNVLGKASFGKLALFWVSVPLMSVLIDLSQRSYIKYYYIHYGDDVKKLIISIKFLTLVLTLILFGFFVLKDYFKIYIIDRPSDYFILLSALFFALIELYLSYFQIKGAYKKYNIVFILRNALPYVLAALVLQFILGDVYTFMKIQLGLMVLIVFALSRGDFSIGLKYEEVISYLEPSIKFSLPFIPAMLSVMALSFSDRFIINYYYSEIEVAEYTVAYTVSSVFMAFFLATNKMWQKFILENLKDNNILKISKTSKKYILIISLVGIVVVLFKDLLVSLMSNDSYTVILDIIPVIIAGMFFYFLYTVLSNIPFYHKNTLLMTIPAIIAAILNIVLNFVLIPKYGYKIAAMTTTISYFVEFLIIYIICLKKYKTDILFNGFTKRFLSKG